MTVYNAKTGSGVWSDPGADPSVIYGPVPAAGTTGTGLVYPPMRLGTSINGTEGGEFILAKLVLGSATDMLPGEFYTFDRDYTATKLSTATSVLNQEVGVAQVFSNQQAAGTYYLWLARAGHLPVRAAAASVATGFGETTATAGVAKFPATPTTTAYSINPSSVYVASAGFTFTATTTNGSPTLTNVSSIKDVALGASIAGTGIPSNAIVSAIRPVGNGYVIDIGTSTTGALTTLQNCTATANNITVTVTLTLPANVYWPTLNKLN